MEERVIGEDEHTWIQNAKDISSNSTSEDYLKLIDNDGLTLDTEFLIHANKKELSKDFLNLTNLLKKTKIKSPEFQTKVDTIRETMLGLRTKMKEILLSDTPQQTCGPVEAKKLIIFRYLMDSLENGTLNFVMAEIRTMINREDIVKELTSPPAPASSSSSSGTYKSEYLNIAY